MDTYIKLYRRFIYWEWYQDSRMVHLFIHLVLSANRFENNWKGISLSRGQLIGGRKKLCKETGISEQSIRTCLNNLKSTNEITIEPTNDYTVITICNYDRYQLDLIDSNQGINQESTKNQPHLKKERKKEKKEPTIFSLDDSEKLYADFLAVAEEKLENGKTSKERVDLYRGFIGYIFGRTKENNIPLEFCLSMKGQIRYEDFEKLLDKYSRDLIKTKTLAMENHPNVKGKTFYLTLNNWCSRDNRSIQKI